jgi:predicted O-linked N-acetylglucosamine transferase (SPINDLY family)
MTVPGAGDRTATLEKLASFADEIHTLEEAVLILQQLLAIMPEDVQARHLLRSIQINDYEHHNQLDKTINALKIQAILAGAATITDPVKRVALAEEALALNPYHVKANVLLATAASAAQLTKVAAFAYETLAHRFPEDKAYLHRLGEIYEKRGDLIEAQAVYEEITELDPDDVEAHEKMMKVSGRLKLEPAKKEKGPSEASEEIEKILREGPTRKELQSQIEACQEEIGKLKAQAREEPSLLDEFDQKIRSLRNQMDQFEAEIPFADCRALQAAKDAEPENPDRLAQLGEALMHASLWHKATQAFDELCGVPEYQEGAFVSSVICTAHRVLEKARTAEKG